MFPSFKLFGSTIMLYPLLMGLAWGAAINLVLYYNKKLEFQVKHLRLLLILQFLAAWLGAKLFFILTAPDSLHIPNSANFWLGGGFVFYGGMITTTIVTVAFFKLKQIAFVQTNIFIPALALGHAIGRLGCFFAGCCFGSTCELPWAIHLYGVWRHPVQLYEAFSLFALFLIFHVKVLKNQKIILWPYYFISYGLVRIVMEVFRGDKIRGVYTFGLSTSQIVSIVMIGASIIYLVLMRRRHP